MLRPATHGPPRRILLVEDQPVNQRVAVAMLEYLGCRVDVVSDGAQAVKAAFRKPYRAILMDCQIPVLDGYRATGEIRRLQGDQRRIPIIAVSPSSDQVDQERCLAAGMDDYLTKPLSLKALTAVLDLWAPDLDPPKVDSQAIDRLERLGEAVGEDLMGQLAVLFIADAEALILSLRGQVMSADSAGVAASAHTLRGSTANMGATHLSHLCARMEADGEEYDLTGAEALLDEIGDEFERVRAALDALIPVT